MRLVVLKALEEAGAGAPRANMGGPRPRLLLLRFYAVYNRQCMCMCLAGGGCACWALRAAGAAARAARAPASLQRAAPLGACAVAAGTWLLEHFQ